MIQRIPDYVEEPTCLGEHLRKHRKLAKLRQVDVARVLNANSWTYINWEKNDVEPAAQFIPGIIKWLGYDPYPTGKTFGEKIKWMRKKAGLSRRELADRLELNYSSVEQWERGVCVPKQENMNKLERLIRKY